MQKLRLKIYQNIWDKKMEILEKYKGSSLGMYDNNSQTQNSVLAYKVIDVTELLTDVEQVVIKYAKVTRGTIAQICDWYKKGTDLGLTIHWHIDHMTPEQLANDEVFNLRCKIFEVDALVFANVIIDNKN